MISVVIFGVVCVLCLGWMFYMMTFKPRIWLELVKDERERKQEAHKRAMEKRAQLGKAVNVAAIVAQKLWKLKR